MNMLINQQASVENDNFGEGQGAWPRQPRHNIPLPDTSKPPPLAHTQNNVPSNHINNIPINIVQKHMYNNNYHDVIDKINQEIRRDNDSDNNNKLEFTRLLVKVGESYLYALVDTGSEVTAISEAIYKQLPKENILGELPVVDKNVTNDLHNIIKLQGQDKHLIEYLESKSSLNNIKFKNYQGIWFHRPVSNGWLKECPPKHRINNQKQQAYCT
ncbi:hypothetical protein HCN44_004827 [Aphidius gifuensis]|uniref:Uncharacterized protein n=1 Tax=Aphidius gifuensis TaxID=684658 RepID=A0A834XU10_APHGI|nr:hypothetical protein HCN44_004827 [Aphidius gifuensis]